MRRGIAIALVVFASAGCGGHAVTRPSGLIVFDATSTGSGSSELYVADLDSGKVRQLTRAGGYNPSWSPDGSEIAFDWESSGPCNSPACNQIWLIGVDGSHRRPFTPANIRCEGAAWSPTGDRIAYVQWRPSEEHRSSIYVRTIDGGEVHRLTFANAFDLGPVWSPDGQRIAFYREADIGPGEAVVMNADGTDQRRLTWTKTDTDIGPWSPDGRRFAFSRVYGQYGDKSLFGVRNADGTGERILVRHGLDPVWSPDGRFIAFIPDEEESLVSSVIYVVRADGTGRRRLFGRRFTEPGNLDWVPQQ